MVHEYRDQDLDQDEDHDDDLEHFGPGGRALIGQHGSIAIAESFILTVKSGCLRVLSFAPLRFQSFRREVAGR